MKYQEKIIPAFILQWGRQINYNLRLKKAGKEIKHELEFRKDLTEELQDVLAALKVNRNTTLPHTFTKKYNVDDIVVYFDNNRKLRYVLDNNKKIYFKKAWTVREIKKAWNILLCEQDKNSPHRYESETFKVCDGDIVIDAGSAEGNFALSVVEKAGLLYLFEVDQEWIECLEATFEPWKDKVIIINKYISDKNDNNCMTLDELIQSNTNKQYFIKADIEGAELKLLAGGESILSQNIPIKISICTYHNPKDAENINEYLSNNGFSTKFSKGFIISPWSKPYLRKGLIRATKNPE
jgi:hypothetical protein